MPTRAAHLKLVERNEGVRQYLERDFSPNVEWIVTVAFYTALHPKGHRERKDLVKTKHSQIFNEFRQLYNASRVARYLQEDQDHQALSHNAFLDFASEEKVRSIFLEKHLAKIAAYAKTQ